MAQPSPGGMVPAQAAGNAGALTNLIYRSKATSAFDAPALADLLSVAVRRNADERLTGTLVYDQGRFVQWLEGPRASLDRVVSAIRVDPRHAEFEVLRERTIRERAFSDWQMRLAVRRSQPFLAPQGALQATDAPLDALISYPDAAPSLLRVLFNIEADNDDRVLRPDGARLRTSVERFVSGLGFSPVFDDTQPDRAPADISTELAACARELARLFSSEQDDIDSQRVEALCRTAGRGLDDFVRLFGRTASTLGDLWHDNRCTEADIAVALSEMQITYARMRRHGVVDPDRNVGAFKVMVAQMPGDLHIVGSILKADVLRSRGWSAVSRFPATRDELLKELSQNDFDGLVIATSRVSSSTVDLDRLRALVTDVRNVSCNRRIVIVVGGRVFTDSPLAWREVGADAAADTPLALPPVLKTLLVL
ncbi:BLUF domain-containing protein [Palleronia sp. KMU-117]|uniref:BLUF domain-containing protein n=1 Tax=Palleronia sp. KMU-117 TaxID=3434108 RepID=UPI003D7052C5